MSAANLHALMSLMCELERCSTAEDMRRLVTTPGLVAQQYQRIRETEGGDAVTKWLGEQFKAHINARAIAAQQPAGATSRGK
jgi:hypothetical protein